jgi:hypothetical protein
MLTREQLLRVMALLGDAYPTWASRKSETQTTSWLALLEDIPYERLKIAAITHAQNSNYPPTIAELRSRAEIRESKAPEEAWALCRRAASHVSPYCSDERYAQVWAALEAKDKAAAEALRSLGGFSLMHGQLAEDVPTNRAHFARAYEAITSRQRRDSDEEIAQSTLARGAPGMIGKDENGQPRQIGDLLEGDENA